MIYLDPFYAKSLARHAIINEDSTQTLVKSLCPSFSLVFAPNHDLADHRCFLHWNSVLPTYLQMSSTFSFSSGSVRDFRSFRMQTQKHGFVTCVHSTHGEICPRSNDKWDFLQSIL